jgi:hypothetical protein
MAASRGHTWYTNISCLLTDLIYIWKNQHLWRNQTCWMILNNSSDYRGLLKNLSTLIYLQIWTKQHLWNEPMWIIIPNPYSVRRGVNRSELIVRTCNHLNATFPTIQHGCHYQNLCKLWVPVFCHIFLKPISMSLLYTEVMAFIPAEKNFNLYRFARGDPSIG